MQGSVFQTLVIILTLIFLWLCGCLELKKFNVVMMCGPREVTWQTRTYRLIKFTKNLSDTSGP